MKKNTNTENQLEARVEGKLNYLFKQLRLSLFKIFVRFLKLHANEYSDVTEFGAETWGYGAFNWFSNHPVITYN